MREVLEAAGLRFGPEFARAAGSASIAVNGVDVRSLDGLGTELGPEDEVALLPPVSGGSTIAQTRPARWPFRTLGAEAVFWLGLIAASWIHPWALTALAGVAAGLTTVLYRQKSSQAPRATLAATAAAAAAFAPAAHLSGLPGQYRAAAGGLVLLALVFIALPKRPSLLPALGLEVCLTFYLGFLSSFLVMLRRDIEGHRTVTVLVLIVAAYFVARTVFSGSLRSRTQSLPEILSVRALTGVAAAEVASLVAGRAFLDFLPPVASAILGLVAGACLWIGEAAGHSLRGEGPEVTLAPEPSDASVRELFRLVEPFALAAPVFYFGIRFYLI